MDMKIIPTHLSGTLEAISSKSFAHRLLICAALADNETYLTLNGMSDDIDATIGCLEEMGAGFAKQTLYLQKSSKEIVTLKVIPLPKSFTSSVILSCGESGTTARFLLPLAAYLFDHFTLTGTGRLPERPFAPLCQALEKFGCTFDGDRLPLTGMGKIQAGDFQLAGDISSQFISGLLFTLPLLEGDSHITLTTPLESAAYVDMTIQALNLFGIEIKSTESGYFIRGNQHYRSPGHVSVEGDWSNAAFFFSMGALSKQISLRGLSMSSTQGDKEILNILRRFGANIDGCTAIGNSPEFPITVHPPGDAHCGVRGRCRYATAAGAGLPMQTLSCTGGRLQGIAIDASQIPDLVPTLAVVGSVAAGETRIFNGERLRMKESDRIQSTFQLLSDLGADVEMTKDGLIIRGRERLRGGMVDSAGDHRIVMAAATAACVCENPVIIKGYEAVNKSYPGFFDHFKQIGGKYND